MLVRGSASLRHETHLEVNTAKTAPHTLLGFQCHPHKDGVGQDRTLDSPPLHPSLLLVYFSNKRYLEPGAGGSAPSAPEGNGK